MADPQLLWLPGQPERRAKVVVKADLIPAVSMLSLVALVGVPLGLAWSLLAPPQRLRVYPGNLLLPLTDSSFDRFDGIAIFLLLGLGAGFLVGALVWLRRSRRGPVALLAASGGMALAGWLAMLMGTSFANSRYPAGPSPQVGDVVLRAPTVSSGWVLLVAPLAVAFAYGTLAAWNGYPDLGRRR